jgi:hypothetical protein
MKVFFNFQEEAVMCSPSEIDKKNRSNRSHENLMNNIILQGRFFCFQS